LLKIREASDSVQETASNLTLDEKCRSDVSFAKFVKKKGVTFSGWQRVYPWKAGKKEGVNFT
jgi:hypothetical protein